MRSILLPLKATDILLYHILYGSLLLFSTARSLLTTRYKNTSKTVLYLDPFGIEVASGTFDIDFTSDQYTHPYPKRTYAVHVSTEASRIRRIRKDLLAIDVRVPRLALIGSVLPHTHKVIHMALSLFVFSKFVQRVSPCSILAPGAHTLCQVAIALKLMYAHPMIAEIRGNTDLRTHFSAMPTYFPCCLPTVYGRALTGAWDHFIQHLFYSLADMVLCYNRNNMHTVIAAGAHPFKTSMVRIEVDLKTLNLPLVPRDSLCDFPQTGRAIVLWSRLESQKLVLEACHSACLCLQDINDAHLVVIGNGGMKTAIAKCAQELNVSSRVHLLGRRPFAYIRSAASHSDVVLAPMSGSSLAEAAMLACPIVAYDIEWHSELITDGKTGLLVEIMPPERMAEAIERLLNDPPEARSLGLAARDAALEIFDKEKIRRASRAVYHNFYKTHAPHVLQAYKWQVSHGKR
jgi:glycosyltransferase involved in cell wall biosynthesis